MFALNGLDQISVCKKKRKERELNLIKPTDEKNLV